MAMPRLPKSPNSPETKDGIEGTGARSKDTALPEKEVSREMHGEKKESGFECNICLDVASDAVISMCGHLFCWPCIHQWLETRPRHQICPVCRARIGQDKVVPLYGRGNHEQKDPRKKTRPLPGPRPEPVSNSQNLVQEFQEFSINLLYKNFVFCLFCLFWMTIIEVYFMK